MKTFALLLLVLTTSTLAQHSSSAQLEEMKKLDFLIGEWRGEGWAEFIPGQRRTSSITENVQPKLGGMVLLIEGLGKAKVAGKEEEVAVHHALGIVVSLTTQRQNNIV